MCKILLQKLLHPIVQRKYSKLTLGGFDALHHTLWQYGLWSFQTEGTKLERFLPMNQQPQRKLLNFENWISGGLRSLGKSEF